MYRVGWIHYTNAAPLLDYLQLPSHIKTIKGVPTEINKALLARQVDLANISAIEFIRNADQLRALPGWSIAAMAHVESVLLFHDKPLTECKRIAVTSQSAMSVALLQVLLKQWKIQPQLECQEGPAEMLLTEYDAVLRIGDDALKEWYERSPQVQITDLATAWWKETQLPFTFAVWAYHKDNPPPPELLCCMKAARDYGLGHLQEVAGNHAQRLGLPVEVVQSYLWNIRYHLEEIDYAGLATFAQMALPDHAPLILSES